VVCVRCCDGVENVDNDDAAVNTGGAWASCLDHRDVVPESFCFIIILLIVDDEGCWLWL
jgi:hypothetical protein